MYSEYYGFARLPFQMTPDVRFFFDSPGHKRARSTIIYGLSKNEGFVVITGAVGAGKTTLIEYLMARGQLQDAVVAQINTTQLESQNLLQLIAYTLEMPRIAESKAGILRDLKRFLLETKQRGKRVLVVVDEVQNLSQEALEELRMLSNFQDHEHSLLQMLLVGQPEFRDRLSGRACEQIRQRVVASYHLAPLNAGEVRKYVEHRLRSAGWQGEGLFSPQALERIAAESGGVPRKINRLCDRLLLYGYLEEMTRLDSEAVETVVADMRRECLEGDPPVSGGTGGAAPPVGEAGALRLIHGSAAAEPGQGAAGSADYAELVRTVETLQRELAAYKQKIGRIVEVVASEQRRLHETSKPSGRGGERGKNGRGG